MSSIHYKFRSTLEYKTLQFDGLHIRGEDLVREICAKENIKIEIFNLLLQNAHTKKNYTDDELIPRNSSIIIQRVPRTEAGRVQKVQSGVNSGMVQDDSSASGNDANTHISTTEFENMDESERLSHVRDVSTRAYDPSNFRKKTGGIMTGPPPPTYTCNRCYQPGHWYKNCPMLNTKRTTGIPSQELMETTADDPDAMLHPSGKYVIPIMHWKAKQEQARKTEEGSSSPAYDRKVPTELKCPICQHLIKEAVVTACCGNSYCADCIGQRLFETETKKCPDCENDQISVDSLIPNKRLREAAEAWLTQGRAGGRNTPQTTDAPPPSDQIRIRIGLQPKAPTAVVAAAPSPITVPPASQEGVTVTPGQAVLAAAVAAAPVTQQTINIPLDTSLPPPTITAPAATVPQQVEQQTVVAQMPSIPGVPGLSIPYNQPPPGIPGIPGMTQMTQMGVMQQQQQQQMMGGYILTNPQLMYTTGAPNHGHAGYVGMMPTTTSRSGLDMWDQFLQRKDRDTERREGSGRRDRNDRDRDRERERERDRRREREKRERRKRSSSESSDSSDSSEDDRRRRRREKSSRESKSVTSSRSHRRADEKSSRRDHRDRDRDREETKTSRGKEASSTRHREKRRGAEKKEVEDDHKKEEEKEEKKDDDEEAAIDGALAEYEKMKESTSGGGEGKDGEEEEEEEEERESVGDGETTRSERDESEKREEEAIDAALTTETSEAEVVETAVKLEAENVLEEESEMTAEEKESKHKKSKDSQSSDDQEEDEKKEKKKEKKHKKHKKSKKHKKKGGDEEEDDDNETSGEKKKKHKHKKHKKEKKEEKEKEKEERRMMRKERKRSREAREGREAEEQEDSDVPRSKVRKSEEKPKSTTTTVERRDDEKRRREKEDKRKEEKEKPSSSDRRPISFSLKSSASSSSGGDEKRLKLSDRITKVKKGDTTQTTDVESGAEKLEEKRRKMTSSSTSTKITFKL